MVPKLRKCRKGSVLEDPLLWRVNYILAIISEIFEGNKFNLIRLIFFSLYF